MAEPLRTGVPSDMEYDADPSFAVPATDPQVLQAPSHIFGVVEAELDEAEATLLSPHRRPSDTEPILGRPHRTEGQLMGDLALINLFGSVKRARKFKELQRRNRRSLTGAFPPVGHHR